MKIFAYFFSTAILGLSSLLAVSQSKEIEVVEGLIKLSECNVETQKNLRALILDYQTANANYIQNPDDRDSLLKTAKLALRTSQIIQDNHLEHLFTQEFMSELNLFAQIAKKMGIPKT